MTAVKEWVASDARCGKPVAPIPKGVLVPTQIGDIPIDYLGWCGWR